MPASRSGRTHHFRRDAACPVRDNAWRTAGVDASHAVHPLARALVRVSTDVLRDASTGPVFVGGGGDVDHGGRRRATLTAVAESVDDTGWAPIRPTCE